MEITLIYIFWLIIIGLLVGSLSGLLGIGGGFLMVPLQYFLLTSMGLDNDTALRISTATSLAVIIPTSFTSSYSHYIESKFDLTIPIKLGFFGIIGSFLGGYLAVFIPAYILSKLLALIFILVAINMIFNKKEYSGNLSDDHLILKYLAIGLFVGLLSGLFGIGGGVVIIPILIFILGYSMINSVGISSVFIFISSFGGVISYILSGGGISLPFTIGYVNVLNFIIISSISIPLAILSSKVAHKVPQEKLKMLFAILLVFMSIKLLEIIPFI